MKVLIAILLLTAPTHAAKLQCERFDWNDDERGVADNDQVLHYKRHSENNFKAQAYVHGRFVRYYSKSDGTVRFQIQISPSAKDTIEINYYEFFNKLPELKRGDVILACGQYETHRLDTINEKASPDGAYITETYGDTSAHPGRQDGFLFINGRIYE